MNLKLTAQFGVVIACLLTGQQTIGGECAKCYTVPTCCYEVELGTKTVTSEISYPQYDVKVDCDGCKITGCCKKCCEPITTTICRRIVTSNVDITIPTATFVKKPSMRSVTVTFVECGKCGDPCCSATCK